MIITFEPQISSALWLTMVVCAAGLLGGYAWRRPRGLSRQRWSGIISLMAIGTGLPLVILLNPTWRERIPPPAGRPRLAIVVDSSASMAATDMPDGRSRYQAAVEIANSAAAGLADRFEIHAFTFAGTVLPTSVDEMKTTTPRGQITNLASAISESVDASRPAGQAVLLLSDGNHNGTGGTAQVLAAVSLARTVDAPIYTRTLGSDAGIHDLAIRLHAPQQLSFIGQSVPVAAFVRRRGRAPQGVTVVLSHEGNVIDRKDVFIGSDAETEVRFHVRQVRRGLYRYEVHIEPFEGEVTQVNNYGTFLLRVVDEPIRVLLVEGKPYWDTRFLMRTLASDSSIEPVSVVRIAEGRYLERTLKRVRKLEAATTPGQDRETETDGVAKSNPAIAALEVPVTESWRVLDNGLEILGNETALGTFQVVILGRDSESFLTEQAVSNLRNWVASDSGALVCSRGQPMAQVNERLDRLLPIQWGKSHESRFRIALTDRGRDLRWFESRERGGSGDTLQQLPTLATSASAEPPRPLATVLASVAGGTAGEEEVPVVTYQPFGGGRVVVVEGAGMWRWAFLPPAYADHDSTYSSLWQGLLRWLVSGAGLLPGQDMALRTDQVTFGSNEPATATLLVRREAALGQIPHVELTSDAIEGIRSVSAVPEGDGLGVYRLMFGELPEGRYQARIAGQSPEKSGSQTVFDVRRLMEEQLDLKARPELMERIATNTGGIELKGNASSEIAEAFKSHLERARPERIRRTIAWDRWWVMLGMIGVWATAWGLRRRSGLV
jgi:hypothetical protein